MTAPIPITPLRPGPTGPARSGSLVPFTNLAADLDTNFNAIKAWATALQPNLDFTTVTYTTWLTLAPNWALYSGGTYSTIYKLGRMVWLSHVSSYTGTVVSGSTGDVTPDLLVATIKDATLRPANALQVNVPLYVGALVMGSLTINTDGTIYLTGLSTAMTVVNPGVAFYVCYYLPP